MVKTQDGGSRTKSIRPTTFVRSIERGEASNIVEEDNIGGNVGEDVSFLQPKGYPGRPYDRSSLVSYEDYVTM